jgi:AcrR family transcriptional regulator
MSPRPRKVTDEALFEATYAAMTKLGPHELTLAAIAKEAGVTAAVLVQRFGSKRDLLLTLAERYSDGAAAMMAGFTDRHRSPLAALRDYAECMAGMASSPAALARNFAYLQIDLTDPDFRVHLAKGARATRDWFRQLIRSAVDAGELDGGLDPARMARTIEAVVGGSMLSWAFYQEGSAARWVRSDLDAVLEPYLSRKEPNALKASKTPRTPKAPTRKPRPRGKAAAG